MKAVFFDRDDTLIQDSGYMHKKEDLRFFEDTISTLQALKQKGYEFFIVTNQSGIGRGYFTLEQMHSFNQFMLDEFKKYDVEIKEVVFCPHSPKDNCDCRKPSPKLINDLCKQYNIEKHLSYMIGDKDSDFQAGLKAGLKSYKIVPGSIKSILNFIK